MKHGSHDPLVSPVQSVQMFKALKEKGSDVRYIVLEGAKQGDIACYQLNVINTVVNLFKEKLGSPIDGGKNSETTSGNL